MLPLSPMSTGNLAFHAKLAVITVGRNKNPPGAVNTPAVGSALYLIC